MAYEFKLVKFARMFPNLRSIYQPLKLARSLEEAAKKSDSQLFLNLIGMNPPKALRGGDCSSEYNEKRESLYQSIAEHPEVGLDSAPMTRNYVKEHDELLRVIASTRKPIVSIIGGEISQPTFALSCYTPFKIVTEDALIHLAGPSIGLMSGLTYMFSRIPDGMEFSRFALMSSAVLGPRSALLSGIATHYVKYEDIEQLIYHLCSEKAPNLLNAHSIIDNYSTIPQEEHFSSVARNPPCFISDVKLYKMMVEIFSPDSLEEVLEKLHQFIDSDINSELKSMLNLAAESLSKERRIETILRLLLIKKAKNWDLNKCLEAENYLKPQFIKEMLSSHPSIGKMSSIAGLVRELMTVIDSSVIPKLKVVPQCSKELFPNLAYREVLEIPSTDDVYKVVSGEVRDSDGYSLEESDLNEWFKNNWGFYHGDSTSEDEKVHTNLSVDIDLVDDKIVEEKESPQQEVDSPLNQDETVCFKNHTHSPSNVRMMVILEKIKRTVYAYCSRIGDQDSFLKWGN